jgi:pyruvate/2-oxoacid:ferredoxin oxidoreductase beta subunit
LKSKSGNTPQPSAEFTTHDPVFSIAFQLHSLSSRITKSSLISRKSGKGRIPVKEFISKQGRFDHLKEEHYAHIQNMVDQMWEEWQIPGVAPLRGILKARI